MSRRTDLEQSILDSYDIIHEYEQQRQLSDRPEQKLLAKRQIEEQWRNIEGYWTEYRKLADTIPKDIAEIVARFGPVQPASAPATATASLEDSSAELTRGNERTTVQSKPIAIEHYYAMLVGVRDYVQPIYRPLPHTVYDVAELDGLLRGAGYTVRTLHNDQSTADFQPTRANIWESLESLAAQTGPGDLMLVYFGGHGVVREGRAYLVPTDGGQASLHRTAIDLKEFKQTIARAGAQARVLLLDACHSGIGRDAATMDAEFERRVHLEATGTATLAACRQGEVAYEYPGTKHGAFTHFLLQGLHGAAARQGARFVTLNALNDYVTNEVKKWAIAHNRQQWPNATTRLAGDPPLIRL
jgi:hypothetical protein